MKSNFILRLQKPREKIGLSTKSPIGVSYQPKIEYCMVMKNTHMSCPISPQGHCRRGKKMKLTFRLVFFVLACWLTERQGEGNQGQNKLRFYFESRQVCTFDFA